MVQLLGEAEALRTDPVGGIFVVPRHGREMRLLVTGPTDPGRPFHTRNYMAQYPRVYKNKMGGKAILGNDGVAIVEWPV